MKTTHNFQAGQIVAVLVNMAFVGRAPAFIKLDVIEKITPKFAVVNGSRYRADGRSSDRDSSYSISALS